MKRRGIWLVVGIISFLGAVLPFVYLTWLNRREFPLSPASQKLAETLNPVVEPFFILPFFASGYIFYGDDPWLYVHPFFGEHAELARAYWHVNLDWWLDLIETFLLWYVVVCPLVLGVYSFAVGWRRPKGEGKGQFSAWRSVLETLYGAGIVRVGGLMLVFLGIVWFDAVDYSATLSHCVQAFCALELAGIGVWLGIKKWPSSAELSRREKLLVVANAVGSFLFSWTVFYMLGGFFLDYAVSDSFLQAFFRPSSRWPGLEALAHAQELGRLVVFVSALGLVILRLWPRLNRFFRLASKVGWLCFSASVLLMWLFGTLLFEGLVDLFKLGPLAFFGLGLVVSSAAVGVLWPTLRSLPQRWRW